MVLLLFTCTGGGGECVSKMPQGELNNKIIGKNIIETYEYIRLRPFIYALNLHK